ILDTGDQPLGPDASNILTEVPDDEDDADSSAIRLEAPGLDRTLEDQPSGGFDLTVSSEPPPAPAPRPGSKPAVNWPEPSGSDLFAESGRSSPEFDLSHSADLSPFDPTLKAEQPSLGSAPSSIFTGGKVPGAEAGGASGASGSVPVGK